MLERVSSLAEVHQAAARVPTWPWQAESQIWIRSRQPRPWVKCARPSCLCYASARYLLIHRPRMGFGSSFVVGEATVCCDPTRIRPPRLARCAW